MLLSESSDYESISNEEARASIPISIWASLYVHPACACVFCLELVLVSVFVRACVRACVSACVCLCTCEIKLRLFCLIGCEYGINMYKTNHSPL